MISKKNSSFDLKDQQMTRQQLSQDNFQKQTTNKESESQLSLLKGYLKNCLLQKRELQKRCKQLESENKMLKIGQKLTEQLKNQHSLVTQQLNNYKAQLFMTRDKLKQTNKQFMEKVIVNGREKQHQLEVNQQTYKMKIARLESQLQKVQVQNHNLKQHLIKIQNQLKYKNIDNQQLQYLIDSNEQFRLKDIQNQNQKQIEISLKQKYQTKLKRIIQAVQQQFQLKLIRVKSQFQVEQYKYQTMTQECQNLSSQIQKLNQELIKTKNYNHQLLTTNDDLNKKYLDTSYVLQSLLSKIDKLQNQEWSTLIQYVQIIRFKLQRIQKGKDVTYLQSNSKNFLSINQRNTQIQSDYMDKVISQIQTNNRMKQRKIKQKQNVYQNYSQNEYLLDFSPQKFQIGEINVHSQKKEQFSQIQLNAQKQKRFTFNPFQIQQKTINQKNMHQIEHSHKIQLKQQLNQEISFENKILKQRNAIEARIRQKYQSEKKTFNQQSSFGKENYTNIKKKKHQDEKIIHKIEKNQKQKSNYLTRQFSFDIET